MSLRSRGSGQTAECPEIYTSAGGDSVNLGVVWSRRARQKKGWATRLWRKGSRAEKWGSKARNSRQRRRSAKRGRLVQATTRGQGGEGLEVGAGWSPAVTATLAPSVGWHPLWGHTLCVDNMNDCLAYDFELLGPAEQLLFFISGGTGAWRLLKGRGSL